ncbi:MAG TPA: adenylate/guanylate cyclase domain-containing protein [Candidatus Cybelea sp.]|nr:adenylate/guanylate cyclase domain-containing protein [Candidatus Cybelea sp.]
MAEASPLILVVDDEENNRYTLTRRLLREGYSNVIEAANGLHALDLLAAKSVDLILLDIMMPEMDGYDLLTRLKSDALTRMIPVIMISALDAMDSVVRCIELGAEDYLPKPFNPILLKARIGASLEKKRFRDQELSYISEIERERRRSDELLHAILPSGAVKELKSTNSVKPRRYENVAVLFCDIVDFTAYCDRNDPERVVADLQRLNERFEAIIARHSLEKIKTIGDALLATAGLLHRIDEPLLASVRCGLEMIAAAQSLEPYWGVRVGVHFGAVVAGVVGRRQFLFDLWGDTVNTAARVTSCANINSVFLSNATWALISERCRGRSRGTFELKGKGQVELVECHAVDT